MSVTGLDARLMSITRAPRRPEENGAAQGSFIHSRVKDVKVLKVNPQKI